MDQAIFMCKLRTAFICYSFNESKVDGQVPSFESGSTFNMCGLNTHMRKTHHPNHICTFEHWNKLGAFIANSRYKRYNYKYQPDEVYCRQIHTQTRADVHTHTHT